MPGETKRRYERILTLATQSKDHRSLNHYLELASKYLTEITEELGTTFYPMFEFQPRIEQ